MRSTIDSGVADALTGYAHPKYADSLAEFGVPRGLPRCKGWILQRPIPGFSYHDGMGCYPLFACQDWSQLHTDLEDLEGELVSLSLVADPFGGYNEPYLRRCFKDIVTPYKEHYVADLYEPVEAIVSKHHRHYALKALRRVHVERCIDPTRLLDEWVALFANLKERHTIRGIKTFSREAFAKQLGIPGMVMFRAVHQGATVGVDLWYTRGEVAYGHLAAFSPDGYKMRASYALKLSVIEYFINKVRWLDFGAGAGVRSDGVDGLSQFKRGWSTGTRTVYFCGRIFDRRRYSEIIQAKDIPLSGYFPQYRTGEFD
jgi:hypothetical protein